MSQIYKEVHAILEQEYLDNGYKIKTQLINQGLDIKEQEVLLQRYLKYSYAHIPQEFWEDKIPMRVPRVVCNELQTYVEHVTPYNGLGLTLLSSSLGYSVQSLYIMGKRLIDKGFKCFTINLDELLYFLKESWNDSLLKNELRTRFQQVEFLFVFNIPVNITVSEAVMQDLLGILALRRSSNLSCILDVVGLSSLNDVDPSTFAGRIILPYVYTNKPITILSNTVNVPELYKDKWNDQR